MMQKNLKEISDVSSSSELMKEGDIITYTQKHMIADKRHIFVFIGSADFQPECFAWLLSSKDVYDWLIQDLSGNILFEKIDRKTGERENT